MARLDDGRQCKTNIELQHRRAVPEPVAQQVRPVSLQYSEPSRRSDSETGGIILC